MQPSNLHRNELEKLPLHEIVDAGSSGLINVKIQRVVGGIMYIYTTHKSSTSYEVVSISTQYVPLDLNS